MKITWGSYPNHLGHLDNKGCFRCHNADMVDDGGKHVSMECTLCHSILANGSERPFQYLYTDLKENPTEENVARYLLEEFRNSVHY